MNEVRDMFRYQRLWLFCLWALSIPAWALENQLADHPSPYLRLHAQDPVHWQDWGPDVLRKARAENKLILISSGYYACHWCHVMQRESFQDGQVAGRLNADFIPVKVDRELEPVLDDQLMFFLEATRGYGGWPLNVFLTPAGYPLSGTVYLPRDEFLHFIEGLQLRWRQDPERLAAVSQAAAGVLAARREGKQSIETDVSVEELLKGFMTETSGLMDELAGGFGHQAKFPAVAQLNALLTLYERDGDAQIGAFLRTTLDHMAGGGLRDHIGGGFFRYTVDPDWQLPHFEKMLYDNALLASLYLRAAEVLAQPGYRDIAFETLGFLRESMATDSGACIASLSAVDGENVEGGYYLWRPEEVKPILASGHWSVVERAWGFDRPPVLEHGYLPVPAKNRDALADEFDREAAEIGSILDAARKRLLDVRASRSLPRDDKRLAGWNGLALAAFADAARAGDVSSGKAADALAHYIREHLWSGQGLLSGRAPDGEAFGPGNLQDYAYVARGLAAYAEYTDKSEDKAMVVEVTRRAWSLFHTDDGWRASAAPLLPLASSAHHMADGAVPSASAVMLEVSGRLGLDAAPGDFGKTVLNEMGRVTQVLVLEPFDHAGHIGFLMGGRVPGPSASRAGDQK